jgi:hypothetical protein
MNRGLGAREQLREGHSPPPLGGQGYGLCTRPLPLPACGERERRVAAPNAITPPFRRGWAEAILFAFVAAAAFTLASFAAPDPAHAVCSVLSRHPCTPYSGSVFRRQPLTPYSCGVFSRPGCSPELLFPLNQVPLLKVEAHAGPPAPVDREHPVDRLNEIGPLLSKCLELPPENEAQAGMQLALKLAFKRDGELLADPRFTYVTHDAPEKAKAAYEAAALDMLKRCTPLPLTDKFGGAIAGRPLVVAIKENRALGDRRDDAAPVPPGEQKP